MNGAEYSDAGSVGVAPAAAIVARDQMAEGYRIDNNAPSYHVGITMVFSLHATG